MKSLKRSRGLHTSPQSISSKVFVRTTKSGKVQKIVQEQYLRKDIPCSSKLCQICLSKSPVDSDGTAREPVLSGRPATSSTSPQGYYLLPDTNVLLNGIDLFEQPTVFYDVIIIQTVLNEVKNRSLPIYNRVMALIRNVEKRFYLFFNEFRSETYVQRKENESINDRNDRAIRKATAWYSQHLPKKKNITILLLSNDRANLSAAVSEGLTALTLREYVSKLQDGDRLLDLISEGVESRDIRLKSGELLYPDYYSNSKIATLLKDGSIHQGVFRVSPYNYLEGSVKVPAFEKPLLILGRDSSNRSISGDVVVVELLPRDQWKAASAKIIEDDTLNWADDPEDEVPEEVITNQERRALYADIKQAHKHGAESHAQPTARVVGAVRRNWRQYVGVVDAGSEDRSHTTSQKQSTVFLVPMDKKIPKIRIRTRQAGELIGKRIVASIDSWERDTRYPVGHYIRSLGELETKEAETEALLLEYDVQYRPFPQTILDCLPLEGHDWKVPTSKTDPGWKSRTDLRHLLVCSIDPPACQDIDDALHARPLPNGNFEVGVHIADVSHFVKPGNAMDAEASARGTTVYLVDKRIDMLPMLLGTDLCSLKPHVERYAFSTIWEVTPNADVVKASFTKSVILSREGFSYEQAQTRIDDSSQQDELTRGMRILLELSKKLRERRMDAGALNLSSPEVRIETDSETSDPLTDVKTKAQLATNSLVEEFMLLANITVAQKIYQSFPQTALLRRHATPPAANFADLNEQLKRVKGFELDVASSKALATSLDKCEDPEHPFFNTLVRILATRCMTSAEYFCSGSHAEPDYRHYGLASEIYTHFTSPIRRYSDLLVHRQLAFAIGYDGQGSEYIDEGLRNKAKLELVSKNLNVRHRNAQMAGRASIEYYVGQALKVRGEKAPNAQVDVEGYVMRVFENGIVVFVPQFGVEGLARLDDFEIAGKDDSAAAVQSEFDAEAYQIRVYVSGSEAQGRTIRLYQRLVVRISSEQKTGIREQGKRRIRIKVLAE